MRSRTNILLNLREIVTCVGMIQNRGDFSDTVERRNITRASSLGRQESKGPAEQAMRLGVDGTMVISFIVTDRKQKYGCR